MIDQAEPDSQRERAKLADAARRWTRRAVLDIARQAGARIPTRPVFRGKPALDMTIAQAEPMTGIAAARHLEHAARGLTREYIRCAREDGRTWDQIGMASTWSPALPTAASPWRTLPMTRQQATQAAITPGVTVARPPGRVPAAKPRSGIAGHRAGRPMTSRATRTTADAWPLQSPHGKPNGTSRDPVRTTGGSDDGSRQPPGPGQRAEGG
jgi:hypothetical protein